MTTCEMIAVLQAAKAGRQIEYRNKAHESPYAWSSSSRPEWDFHNYDYRVKPEPREWMVYECDDGNIYSGGLPPHARLIKVREVL